MNCHILLFLLSLVTTIHGDDEKNQLELFNRISKAEAQSFIKMRSKRWWLGSEEKTPAQVNAIWSGWQIGKCSTTCGSGQKTRTRQCSGARYGGSTTCSGESFKKDACNLGNCPVNAIWSGWQIGTCSTTCGSGQKTRTRQCSGARYGGKTCPGESFKKDACNLGNCPVNGGYGEWTIWSPCSKTCGGGSRNRNRYCDNPQPRYGGKSCMVQALGVNNETQQCNPKKCPLCKAESVVNAQIITHNIWADMVEDEVVEYKCFLGYKHESGNLQRKCLKNGTLEGSTPLCTPFGSCERNEEIKAPKFGFMSCTGTDKEDLCYIKCKDKHIYQPPSAKLFHCNAKTEWIYKIKNGTNDGYIASSVGECKEADALLGGETTIEDIEALLEGEESEPPSEEDVAKEMREELERLGICSSPCQANVTATFIVTFKFGVGRKRATARHKFDIDIVFHLSPAPGVDNAATKLGAVIKKIKEIPNQLKQALASNLIKIEVKGFKAVLDSSNMKIGKAMFSCKEGHLKQKLECFPCPSGTYLNKASCLSCDFNHYQSKEGSPSCLKCPLGTRTIGIGSKNFTDCIEIDDCLSNPCQNNGTCTDKRNGYDCSCQPAFTGQNCDTDVDFCTGSPCANGGTCVSKENGFQCRCTSIFVGTKCETFTCPKDYFEIKQTCYKISTELATYSGASAVCRGDKGTLATVNSKKIYKVLTKKCDKAYGYWIGLNDIQQEGKFVFSDGSSLGSYNQWHKGSQDGSTQPQPDDKTHQQNCVVMVGAKAFDWFDESCDQKNRYICELN